MAQPYEMFDCESCGRPTPRTRPTRKRCSTCKALNSLVAMSKHPAKCRVCARPFFKRDRGDILCYDCDIPLQANQTARLEEACAICKETDIPGYRREGIPLCFACAMDATTPKRHDAVLSAAVRKLKEIRR